MGYNSMVRYCQGRKRYNQSQEDLLSKQKQEINRKIKNAMNFARAAMQAGNLDDHQFHQERVQVLKLELSRIKQ